MTRSKKSTATAPTRRSTRLKRQGPPTALTLPSNNQRGRPPKANTKHRKSTRQESEEDDDDQEAEIDELAEDTDSEPNNSAAENNFFHLLAMTGEETIQDILGSEGYEDEDTDVSNEADEEANGLDDTTDGIIEIESSRDGSSFYVIEDSSNHSFDVKTEARGGPANHIPTNKSKSSTPALEHSSKRKRDESPGPEAANKSQKTSSGQKDQSQEEKPVKRKPGRPRKKKEIAMEEILRETSSDAEVPEETLDHFILHIPIGDLTDKQDKVTDAVQFDFADTTYKLFLYRVAEAMGVVVGDLPRLSYKFGLGRNAIELPLRKEEEFQKMIDAIKKKAEQERDRVMHEKSLTLGGRKRGPKSATKAKQTQEPCEVHLCRKVLPPTKEDKKKANGGGQSSTWGGVAAKPQKPTMRDFIDRIKERNMCSWPHCNNPSGYCYEVCDPLTKAPAHRGLTIHNIELWANMVAQGNAELSHPPSCIRLFDNTVNQHRRSATQSNMSAGQQPQRFHHLTGAPTGMNSGASDNRLKLPLVQPPTVPMLADWLVECDRTGRGAPGVDDFSSMVFSFELAGFVLLTDLRDVQPKELRELGLKRSDGSDLNMLAGTSLRLIQYVKADLEAFDQAVHAFASNPARK